MDFQQQLRYLNIAPQEYINIAKKKMKELGYSNKDIKSLSFSYNKDKKLMMLHDNNYIHFGQNGYNDFIIYNFIDKDNAITKKIKNKDGVLYSKVELLKVDDNIINNNYTDQDKFEVEKVLDKKKIKNKIHYKVKWKDYDGSDNDKYYPAKNFKNNILIKEFNKKL